MIIAVCWKWVSIGTAPANDSRWAGVSPADEAALELALTLADARSFDGTGERMGDRQVDVVVVAAAPPQADDVLRRALAVGATRVIRIDTGNIDTGNIDSRATARALGAVVAGSDLVLCGDYSLDRGTGSVPAFIAHELGAAQALGLVELHTTPSSGDLHAVRRLDGGRREILTVRLPAVLSVEGSLARLRRASLGAVVAAEAAAIDVVPGPIVDHEPAVAVVPYRPRARPLPAPAGSVLTRVRDILDIGGSAEPHADTVVLDPVDAARRIVEQLESWGYLVPDPTADGANVGRDATR